MKSVAESGDYFTKFSTISQWFQMLIHPGLMQRRKSKLSKYCQLTTILFITLSPIQKKAE
ncbi:MAG: hypothetical protein HRU34_10165 [Richelia sp.]|nr:hypothetical protein [Richelia sp.]CDN14578.1 hypothetical protein RintRC_5022 [Richelia intracellularis]